MHSSRDDDGEQVGKMDEWIDVCESCVGGESERDKEEESRR